MEQPKHYWIPSIAPSGLAIYQGNALAKWQGDLLLGSLKFGQLLRIKQQTHSTTLNQHVVVDNGMFGRIRSVYVRDGDIYFLTDEAEGALIKLSKLDKPS